MYSPFILPCKHSLLPKEAIKRANVRFAIEYFGSKINSGFAKYAYSSKVEGSRETYLKDVNAALVRVSIIKMEQKEKYL